MPAMGDDVSTDRGHGPLLQGFISYLPYETRCAGFTFITTYNHRGGHATGKAQPALLLALRLCAPCYLTIRFNRPAQRPAA